MIDAPENAHPVLRAGFKSVQRVFDHMGALHGDQAAATNAANGSRTTLTAMRDAVMMVILPCSFDQWTATRNSARVATWASPAAISAALGSRAALAADGNG